MARPRGSTKLSRRLIEAIAKCIAVGNTFRTACLATGTSERTFHHWRTVGSRSRRRAQKFGSAKLDNRERLCLRFVQAIEKAEAAAMSRNVRIVQVAARKHWQAAAWWLERRRPQEWARVTVLSHESEDAQRPALREMMRQMLTATCAAQPPAAAPERAL